MKIYRTACSLVFSVYLPLFAVYLYLYLFQPEQLLGFRTIHWVFLLMALALLISPRGKIHYGPQSNRLPWRKWLLSVTGFVTLLSSYFYSSQRFVAEALTIQQPGGLLLPSFFDFQGDSGLFPWALVALLAVSLQRVYFSQERSGHFSDCLHPIFTTTQHNNIGKYCNTYLRITLYFSLVLLFVFTGLSSLHLFMHFTKIPLAVGLNLHTLLATSVLLFVTNFSRWPLIFNGLMKIRLPPLLGMLLMLFTALLLLALTLTGLKALALAELVQYQHFNPSRWPVLWEMLHTFIALSWLPLAATVIAVLSKGYRLDQTVAITLAVPALITVCHAVFFKGNTLPIDTTIISATLLSSAILLLLIFLRLTFITALWRGTFPGHAIDKKRKPLVYLRSMVIGSISLISLFWVSSVHLITLLITAFTLSSTLLIMILVASENYPALTQKKQQGLKTDIT